MKNKNVNVRYLVTFSMLAAILIVMATTPLGTLPIGPLSVSFIMIPVAITAITLGPVAGALMGGLFGVFSYLQCFGVGIPSAMGAVLVEINPFLAFVQRFVPRVLSGLLCGLVFKGTKKLTQESVAGYITGFSAALFNTVFFMLSLVLLFGSTSYMKGLIGGDNILIFICSFVGIQAVVEMLIDCVVVGALAQVMSKLGKVRR